MVNIIISAMNILLLVTYKFNNSTFGSSGYFGSRVWSKIFVHRTYTGIRINLHSRPTIINDPVQKSQIDIQYSRKASAV